MEAKLMSDIEAKVRKFEAKLKSDISSKTQELHGKLDELENDHYMEIRKVQKQLD